MKRLLLKTNSLLSREELIILQLEHKIMVLFNWRQARDIQKEDEREENKPILSAYLGVVALVAIRQLILEGLLG